MFLLENGRNAGTRRGRVLLQVASQARAAGCACEKQPEVGRRMLKLKTQNSESWPRGLHKEEENPGREEEENPGRESRKADPTETSALTSTKARVLDC